MTDITKNTDRLYNKVSDLLKAARSTVLQTVNTIMVATYFEIGRMIVEEEQQGKERAKYGDQLISVLSKKLSSDFGKGFSSTNIKQMRGFYISYSKSQTLSDEFKLSWSHYLFLMRIDNKNERNFYEIESINSNWSLRELKRQFNSALYTRLALSRDKKQITELSQQGYVIAETVQILNLVTHIEYTGFCMSLFYYICKSRPMSILIYRNMTDSSLLEQNGETS